MAKSSKSQNPEFLANRRKAIAEMASRRRRQQLLRASSISSTPSDRRSDVVRPVPVSSNTSATSST